MDDSKASSERLLFPRKVVESSNVTRQSRLPSSDASRLRAPSSRSSKFAATGTGEDLALTEKSPGLERTTQQESLTSSNLKRHDRARSQSNVGVADTLISQPSPISTNKIRATNHEHKRTRRTTRLSRPERPHKQSPSVTSSIYTTHNLPKSSSFTAAVLAIETEQKVIRSDYDSFLSRFIKHGEQTGRRRRTTQWMLLSLVVLIKWIVGLGRYSGQATPPVYGDLEAQRHWMGVTLHRPIREWYFFDLQYWGLDYPPLTAYHSLLLGHLGQWINPHFVALRPPFVNSHQNGWGEFHDSLKNFLRTTVVLSESLTWIPAVIAFCMITLGPRNSNQPSTTVVTGEQRRRSWKTQIISIMTILLHPSVILVDNGHFQYNTVMLGFTVGAVVCFHQGRDLLGSVFFVCSLAFKQMALYYAPAIFGYLLGKCLYLPHPYGLNLFIQLGLTTVTAFALLFAPFFVYPPFPLGIQQALHRIFPVARGLFEDKVANFWCALNVVVKLRQLASANDLAKLSLVVTIFAVFPSVIWLIWTSYRLRPPPLTTLKYQNVPRTIQLLPLALYVSSMGFFLFSFQVHEKSILLPWMAIALVGVGKQPGQRGRDWEWSMFVGNVAIFSMWPLLKRDGLGVQYFALSLFYNVFIGYRPFLQSESSFINIFSSITYSSMLTLHVLERIVKLPLHLPDLFVVINVEICAFVFGMSWLWSIKRLAQETWALTGLDFSYSSSTINVDTNHNVKVGLEVNSKKEEERKKKKGKQASTVSGHSPSLKSTTTTTPIVTTSSPP